MPKRSHGPNGKNTAHDFKTALKLIFNGTFAIVLATNLVVMVIFFFVVVTGAEYVLKHYGTSLSIAGFSSGITVLGCLAGRLLGGAFFSIAGGKKLLLGGLGAFCFSFPIAIFTDSLGGVFAARFISGLGAGMCIAACETIATLAVPMACRGLGISIFSLSVVLGLALGPFLGILLTERVAYKTLMAIMLFVSLPLLAGPLFLRHVAGGHKIHRGLFDVYAYIDPRVIPFSIIIMFIFIGYGSLQIYMTPYAAERNFTASASLFFILYAVSAVISRPFSGRMFDAGKVNAVIYPLFLVTILGLLIMAWAETGAALLLAGILCGIGFGNLQSLGQAIAIGMVSPSRYAQATSTFFNFMNLGMATGPYVFGYAVGPWGYKGMFILIAATVFLAAMAYYFIQRKRAL